MELKVISGGQLGADMAGLVSARDCKLATGGWMPRGFKRLDGEQPWMAQKFGMREHPSGMYSERTEANVKEADATFRFAGNFWSPGERCTLRYLQIHGKLFADFDMGSRENWIPVLAAKWLLENQVKVLNIAGNTPYHCSGIFGHTKQFLKQVFASLQK